MRQQGEINIRDILEDLEGMLGADDVAVATVRCKDLLGDILEYCLRGLGDTNPKRKWNVKLLAKYDSDPQVRWVLERYWHLQFPDNPRIPQDRAAGREYVRACTQFAERVLAAG